MLKAVKPLIGIFYGLFWFCLEIYSNPDCKGDNSNWCKFTNFLFEHKISIAIVVTIIVAILYCILYRRDFNRKRKITRAFLKDFLADNFPDSLGDNRVTIFVRRKGIIFLPKYIWYTLIRLGYFYKNSCLLYRFSKFPWPHLDYLEIYAREGSPNGSFRSTFFLAPNCEEEINSFVSYSYYQGCSEIIDVPSFDKSKIINFKTLKDIKKKDSYLGKKVGKYMALCHIKKLGEVKIFKRTSERIGVFPLCIIDANRVSHVLVFDSVKNRNGEIDKEKLTDKIQTLTNSIGTLLRNY